jgi:hypothetical protein
MKVKVIAFIGILLFFFGLITVVSAQGHSDIIQISVAMGDQAYAQVAYDPNHDEYLVVWEDERNDPNDDDIYGQFVDGDGTLIGENFAVCNSAGDQWWPRLDFDPILNRYLVVFEDWRNGGENGDIRGVFIDSDGDFVDAPTSEADHTFGICTNSSNVYTCSVAFNYIEMVYLVVWGDFRNNSQSSIGDDVYGQIVAADGTLLPPPTPADPTANFMIDADWYESSVADVTYNHDTNEFFVVYGTWIHYVLGQRVSHTGQLINPDGTVAVAKPSHVESFVPAISISNDLFINGPDCFQARDDSRTKYGVAVPKMMAVDYTEVQVVWKGMTEETSTTTFNDVYAQRIGFFWEGGYWVARYVDLNGDTTASPSNYPVSIQDEMVGAPDLAYGAFDDEYLVGWGDPRKPDIDLYVQRLWINGDEEQIFLADDRVNTVTNTENIPVDVTSNYEGSLLGVAHSSQRNEFLIAYVFEDYTMQRGADIYGRRFYGTNPTDVAPGSDSIVPQNFEVSQNFPNPFNPETTIQFALTTRSPVTVKIFDVTGRYIITLLDGTGSQGVNEVFWNGKDAQGVDVTSGVYVYQVKTDRFSAQRKMMLIR